MTTAKKVPKKAEKFYVATSDGPVEDGEGLTAVPSIDEAANYARASDDSTAYVYELVLVGKYRLEFKAVKVS